MASYTRLGSYLLATELAADPAGRINRGLTLSGRGFERHLLIRTFSDELMEAGLGAKLSEAQRVAELFAGARCFGINYHVATGRTGHVACDDIPGRSLAQVLKKTREEQVPLGVDHALSVLQGTAQAIIQLHGKGVHHGTLSPHSIWLSYEGATHVLDAPYAAILRTLLPKAKNLDAQLAPYRSAAALTPLQQDLFALGAILYELLTLEMLPAGPAIPEALSRATLKAAQEEDPIPAEIRGLLERLLMVGEPFATSSAFSEELEKVLYDGEYSPTTFNMAFFMHTLLREESDLDAQAMKVDQAADFSPFLSSDTGSHSVLQGSEPDTSTFKKYAIIGGGVVLVVVGALLVSNHANSRRNEDLQAQIATMQRENSANEAKLLDLTKAQEDQRILQEQLTKKAQEATTAEERAKAKKDLEEAKLKNQELTRQREEALRKRQELNARTQSIAQAAPPVQAPPPEPARELPKPVQVQQPAPQPKPAAAAPSAAPSADIVETPPTIVKRAVPTPPRVVNRAFLPPSLRDKEIRVALKVFVDAQGRPLKVLITRGVDGPFTFNDSAQNAALTSTYSAAQRNGRPTSAWLNLEYNFGRLK